jgi:hypothetical protein
VAAADIEWQADPVPGLEAFDRRAHFLDHAEVLVAEDAALLEIGPALDMCRSDPQMLVLVILTMASVGRSIFGSGTSSTAT